MTVLRFTSLVLHFRGARIFGMPIRLRCATHERYSRTEAGPSDTVDNLAAGQRGVQVGLNHAPVLTEAKRLAEMVRGVIAEIERDTDQ